MSNVFKQAALLTYSGLCSLGERQGTTLVTIVSVAAVVGVLISLLAIREGTSIFQPGRPDEVVVLSRGASTISQSALSREAVATIEDAPGIARRVDGRPFAYAFTVVSVDALRRDGKRGAVSLAGYQEGWEQAGIDIVAGRPYQPGLRELLVSEAVRTMFRRICSRWVWRGGLRSVSWAARYRRYALRAFPSPRRYVPARESLKNVSESAPRRRA